MQEDKIPKVFISYSWSSDEFVLQLAERMTSHGIEVVLDKWELREGQDKYAFMEQCVNNPDIDKVLIICDKRYTEKANKREGGVGDETIIISAEVYSQVSQEKFIPVVAERDENNAPYVPTYIKSRIYIDLSDVNTYEVEYEKLIRNIYEKPLYKKPKLGNRPEWLDESQTNLFPLQDITRQIRGTTNSKKQEVLAARFESEYIDILRQYPNGKIHNASDVFQMFVESKNIRDCFLDFLDVLIETNINLGIFVSEMFETMYNTLISYPEENASNSDYVFDLYKCHIWELFICTTAFLRHFQKYDMIHQMLGKTYFLRISAGSSVESPTNYTIFRHHSRIIEDVYKPTTDKKSKFTLLGDTICTERQKLPLYTKESLAQADLLLYQVFQALELPVLGYYDGYWFPNLYVYTRVGVGEWGKLVSRKYCEKIFPLFGVSTIDELKTRISLCRPDRDMCYSSAFASAPAITNCISVDKIGTMP